MNLTLEQFADGVRRYRKSELAALKRSNAALRGEKLLAELAMGASPTYEPPVNTVEPLPVVYERIKAVDAVRAVINGHPMNAKEVRLAVHAKFPHVIFTRLAIRSRLVHLKDQGEVTHVGIRGKYRYLKVVPLLVGIALMIGCRSTPAPLLMDSGEQEVIATAPRPPNLPPASTAGVRAPLPPRATLAWPPTAKAYRVDYGPGLGAMTNSVVTSATNCHILGSFTGQRYFYRVREMNGRMYGKQVSSGVVETK